MHPADQYQAFSRLTTEGQSPADIAARFGVAVHTVQQRLKLDTVSPALLDRYREGEMTLDCLMASTLSDDLGTRFVGLDAYEAAGGRLLRDLFDEHRTWLLDGDLLGRLAADKLEGVAEQVRAEGWRWIEVGFGYPQGSYGWRWVFPVAREPTPEDVQEREQLETRLEEIAVALDGSEDDALAGEAAGIEQRLAELENALDAFTPEQLALAGAAVWLDHQGAAAIDRGFVRRGTSPRRSRTGRHPRPARTPRPTTCPTPTRWHRPLATRQHPRKKGRGH